MALTRVCIYTRISTDEENQPTSLHSQRERLEAFCTAQEGWRIVAHHEDRATGTKLDRPGLQAALDLARDGRIDLLLVYRVDRLSRKVRQLAQLAEALVTYEVTLRSATEPFDTGSAAGRMMLQMLAVFAEFEHATIVDRVTAGIERRAKEGRWYAGRPPFGYLYSSEHRTLLPDPVKAPVVRRIFHLYTRKRLGTIAIANQLREEDAPAPAAGWGHPAVHWIIGNPTYAGRIRWRDRLFDGVHEPLVDDVTFQRAQAILRERGENVSRRRGNASDFLLSGVVRCGSCGKAYVGMSARGNGGRYEYYACSGRQKHGPKACRNDRLPRHKLEAAVLEQLAALYRDGDLVAQALVQAEQEAACARPEIEQRLASTGAEIARGEQALERYYEAFEQGKLSPERCEDRLARLQTRLEDLRAKEAELSLSSPHEAGRGPTPADLAVVADQLERIIAEGEPQKAKALLRLLIQELRVDGRAQIQPTYRLVTPEVCATYEKVERTGIEPVTSGLQIPDFKPRLGQIRSVNAKLCRLREVEIGYSGTRFGTRFSPDRSQSVAVRLFGQHIDDVRADATPCAECDHAVVPFLSSTIAARSRAGPRCRQLRSRAAQRRLPSICCWPVIRRPSRTANGLKRPAWM